MPLVSVVIDTYNYARFVEDAVDSALAQDFPKDRTEVLVVDDGSTDDTAMRIQRYGDAVRYLQKKNGGQASAINFGTANAKGELVAFLDGDDVWMPNKLSRVVDEFERDPKVVMVYNGYCFWDTRDGRTLLPQVSQVAGDVLADWRKLLEYCAAPTSSLVFRRSALEKLMPVPEPCSFMHDAYLITTVLFLGPVAAVPDCLTKNRVHGANLWFAEGEPGPEVLSRRVPAREAAIKAMRNWLRVNAPGRLRPQARFLLCRWRLIQDDEEFHLRAPGRFRTFRHSWSQAQTMRPNVSRERFVYSCLHAIAVLLVGNHAHYLEGIPTGVRRLHPRTAETTPTGEGGRRDKARHFSADRHV
jgi:Glycosyl transferase family 2